MANHANLDTNAPHLASRGAFWHEEGCTYAWGGVQLATGRGALWRRWGAFPEGGVHQGLIIQRILFRYRRPNKSPILKNRFDFQQKRHPGDLQGWHRDQGISP